MGRRLKVRWKKFNFVIDFFEAAMSLFRFTKLPKAKTFQYTPRYYDPVREEMEERARERSLRQQNSKDGSRLRIRAGFRRRYPGDNPYAHQVRNQQNRRLVLVVVLLLFSFYLLLTELLPFWISLIENR